MNKEIEKAIQKANNPAPSNKIKKWWHKNGIYVLRVVLFPLYFYEVISDKVKQKLYDLQIWDEARVKEILDYYVPRRSHYNIEDETFYFFDNSLGWNIKLARRYIKLKDHRFWKRYTSFGWGGDIRRYLIDKYELEGYTKEVLNTSEGWTELEFKKIKNI